MAKRQRLTKEVLASVGNYLRADAREIEDFLCKLVAARPRVVGGGENYEPHRIAYDDAIELEKDYCDFFPPEFLKRNALRLLTDETNAAFDRPDILSPELTEEEKNQDALDHIFHLGSELRRIWDEQDLRKREWLIFELRRKYRGSVLLDGEPTTTEGDLPDLNLFEQAMVYLQSIGLRTKRCQIPQCARPFIAPRANIGICEKCKADGWTRKDVWWLLKGSEWRKDRPHWRAIKKSKATRKNKGGQKRAKKKA